MSTPPDDAETPHEGILHHLAELERLIERRIVQWDAEDAILVQRRLDRLAAIYGGLRLNSAAIERQAR